MKRSEMISEIKTFMGNEFELIIPTKVASKFLDKIEEVGMAPPCLPSDQCQELMQKYVDPSFNKWEPEDV